MPYRKDRKTNEQRVRRKQRKKRQKESPNMRFYNSKAWRNLRANFIQDNPICVMCSKEGKLVPGDHVDHIKPISEGGAKLEPSNLQTLCRSCHSRKTLEEQR